MIEILDAVELVIDAAKEQHKNIGFNVLRYEEVSAACKLLSKAFEDTKVISVIADIDDKSMGLLLCIESSDLEVSKIQSSPFYEATVIADEFGFKYETNTSISTRFVFDGIWEIN